MRKEEWLRRKWREDKDKPHLEICAFKFRENKIPPKRGGKLNGITLKRLKDVICMKMEMKANLYDNNARKKI